VRVRVLDPGVPARVMEDEVTRQLEEQLAITEGAVAIQSRSSEGRSAVDLSFRYGEDIDQACATPARGWTAPSASCPRASTRRSSTSATRSSCRWRSTWSARNCSTRWSCAAGSTTDSVRSLLTLPGVAAAEVGGGLEREVRIIADQYRLAGLGLDVLDLEATLREANRDVPAGRLLMPTARSAGAPAGASTRAADHRAAAAARRAAMIRSVCCAWARSHGSSTVPPRNGCAFA
jgi:multidrug efflux pump subunit AcrB